MKPARPGEGSQGRSAGLLCLLLSAWTVGAQDAATIGPGAELTLHQLVTLVLDRSETLQAHMLEVEINRRRHRAERGVFEPELFGTFDRVRNLRQNTAEQSGALFSSPLFDERNSIYSGGLESLVPTGARIRLGYTLSDLSNNLQPLRGFPDSEYQTFFGINVTQPLLRGNGLDVTLVNIRLAAATSEIAFQEYRRQLMLLLSTAEASYWNLYMAQEQLRFFDESVALAETILRDNRARFQAGRGSELEVLEAESGLALRKTRHSEARQQLYEAVNRVVTLYSKPIFHSDAFVRAVDQPRIDPLVYTFFDSWKTALGQNPDYLVERKRAAQEGVRLAYARNQRLPQLDFKASYGLNGLGDSVGSSWDDIGHRNFPSWSVGLEVRVPLGGGVRSRNELAAARLRQRQALLRLAEVETQIANALDTAIHKVESTRASVQSYQTVVDFNQNLLETQLARLEVGRVESRSVLEVEADLLQARTALVEALVQYERAFLELELVQGMTLKRRNLEPTPEELAARTARLAVRRNVPREDYRQLAREAQQSFRRLEFSSASAPPTLRDGEPVGRVETFPSTGARNNASGRTSSPAIEPSTTADALPLN